ncbi:MAG: PTS mannose/fructose/sorbose transporter subunit IIB [Erysipelotrichia bacterium]|nr:PTS mannose/fructose/sorbose transporter subunit IIB [Erysipelotrichia bacterium]NCC54138.1 PTS mannose/fructose/sorbose transporter subunit IIB [Erysipelotrichia bacterium]
MIKLLRVDHRLLHGQVAFSWTSSLGADCILIANDAVLEDSLRKTTIKMAKPNGVKLVMKSVKDSIDAINSGVTDKYKLLIVVESIQDAYALAKGCEQVKSINLGGTKAKEGTKNISKAVNVLPEEETLIKELIHDGVEVEIRMVPDDNKVLAEKVL